MSSLLHPGSVAIFGSQANDHQAPRSDGSGDGGVVEGRSRETEERLLPKLPTYGPGSHVGRNVLVARAQEKLGGLSPRADAALSVSLATSGGRRVELPALPLGGLSGSFNRSLASFSQSARGERGSARLRSNVGGATGRSNVSGADGLATLLYKGDHTHRFQGLRVQEEDGPREEVKSTWTSVPTHGERDHGCKTHLRRGNSQHSTKQEGTERDQRIRECFRAEAAEVEDAIHKIGRFQTGMLGQEDLLGTPNGEVRRLVEVFERSNLTCAPMHGSATLGEQDCFDVEDPNTGPPKDAEDRAVAAELLSSITSLNFVRWLCGLPKVVANPVRLRICDMISLALLRHQAGSRNGVLAVPLQEFGNILSNIVGAREDRVSVMHCESSLVRAVQQGLSATHMVFRPRRQIDGASREAAATEIALQVAADSRDDQAARGRRGPRQHEPQRPIANSRELPEALRPLKLFWDLCQDTREQGAVLGCEGVRGEQVEGSNRDSAENKPAHFQRSRRRRCIDATPRPSDMPSGLSPIWADNGGGLGFRRTLLHPDLREFGLARRGDTCVIWTGRDSELDRPEALPVESSSSLRLRAQQRARGRVQAVAHDCVASPQAHEERVDAVCYPPAGIVPISLLEEGCSPWTIMPDSRRFQPTASTSVQLWRVRIDRQPEREWVAERICEMPVQGFTVDCSARGEPFCVLFWPDVREFAHGDQFEVVLGGLCGDTSVLTYFYDLRRFQGIEANRALCREAAKLRTILGDADLWNEPKPYLLKEPLQPHASRGAEDEPRAALAIDVRNRESMCERNRGYPLIETVSHHTTTLTTSRADVTIVLRSKEASCIQAELNLMRGGDDEEEIPRAAQVLKIESDCFIVRIKIPVARLRYKLQIRTSRAEAPGDLQRHPLHYTVLTTRDCQVLMTTLQDTLQPLFGLARLSPIAQHYGVFVVAPLTHRIHMGRCYFLVRVDTAVALVAARASIMASTTLRKEDMRVRSEVPGPSPRPGGGRCGGGGSGGGAPCSTLFSDRLFAHVEKEELASRDVVASALTGCSASTATASAEAREGDFRRLHQKLRKSIESHCQDSGGEIHLDVSMHNGECVHRLHQRHDFHELYEGTFTISEADANTEVKLSIRFPRLQASEYAPTVLGRWAVFRNQHLPIGF